MIDSLCHLDLKYGNPAKALAELHRKASSEGISKVFLCNLPGRQFDGSDGFKNELILSELRQYDGYFEFFAGIDPDGKNISRNIENLKRKGLSGIKLHPRLHKYNVESRNCIKAVEIAGKLDLPVTICGFMDGLNLKLGNLPEAFGRLADKCPGTRILMAHAGGHRIIDSMMVMKSCPNLFLDLSFTVLYYRGCERVMQDIGYVIQSAKGRKILWGTDYPDRPYGETVRLARLEFRKIKLSPGIEKKIFYENPKEFLG